MAHKKGQGSTQNDGILQEEGWALKNLVLNL